MYKSTNTVQISFYDFNQDLGFQLSEDNEWVKLAQIIPWSEIEELYQEHFPSNTGNVAKSARMVLGSLIIQKRKNFRIAHWSKKSPKILIFSSLSVSLVFKTKHPFAHSRSLTSANVWIATW